MEELKKAAAEAAQIDQAGVLRFSVAQHVGYLWQSIRTNNVTVVKFLMACWNNRKELSELLQKER